MNEQFPFDVFLSHSSRDGAFVRPLAERLRQDGLRVWFDEWELKPGDSIPAKIEDGLEHSRVLVLCMSANAFGTDWAQLEAGTFRFRDPLNQERRLIPLRLDDAPVKGSLAQFLSINWRPDCERDYPKLLEACRRPASWPHRAVGGEAVPPMKSATLLPQIADLEEVHHRFLDLLKDDAFTETDRLGEYGRSVPHSARKGSQPDGLAPSKRINAFYTFCAYEYYCFSKYSDHEKDRLQIEDFITRKLSPAWGYYVTRGNDGYAIGSLSASPYHDLNYRHTLALGLTLTLAAKDGQAIDALRNRVLNGNAQAPNGGWVIWETDVGKSDRTDPIATGYAILLLNAFLHMPLPCDEKQRLHNKLEASIAFLMTFLSAEQGLWIVPGNTFAESVQMACWYFDILARFPGLVSKESLSPVIGVLQQCILGDETRQMVLRSDIRDDISVRVAMVLMGSSEYSPEAAAAGVRTFTSTVGGCAKLHNLTTYTITRVLLLLENLMMANTKPSQFGLSGTPVTST